ncbi:MAG: CHAT domain-containing protein, partial [Anaerolineae bacterium]|nr:CHAT domain-containing protein [Anaerolineae bacterium]
FPPARTLAFAVTYDHIQVVDTGLSPTDLLPRQLDSVVERHFLDTRIRRVLYDHLIAPVAPLLAGKRRLVLVPHGPLHYIPFQALPAADGETLLRHDGPELVYAPGATIFFRNRQKKAGPAAATCLAIGYNGEGETRLRFAEQEAHGVFRQVGGRVITGTHPKKMTLYEQAAHYRMLHFSCHGTFDPEQPLRSALHLAPDEYLTALDVMAHLRLSCDLVTLSVCESGLSRVRRGDELVGMIRAFMYAGARALVSSLWRVDERSTRILMERFYQAIQAGTNPACALKQAQLYLKDLTRKEAIDILKPYPPDQIVTSWGSAPSTDMVDDSEYVERLPGAWEDEKIFADPFYWAPFILVSE